MGVQWKSRMGQNNDTITQIWEDNSTVNIDMMTTQEKGYKQGY